MYLLKLPKTIFGRMHKKLIQVTEQVEGEQKMEHTWYTRWCMRCIHFHIVLIFRHPLF